MARYRMVALVAAALMLTGCTTEIPGRVIADPAAVQETHTPLTAQVALGDVTTIDYCSLLDVGSAQAAGVTNPAPVTSSFNYCYADAKLGTQSVEFGLGYLEQGTEQDSSVPDPTRPL